MKKSITLTISGQTYSKANSRQLVTIQSRPRFIKRREALEYEAQALWQLKSQLRGHKPFTVPVGVQMTIYYPDRRQDLDPSLILDIMQKAEVYKNDRLVEEMHLLRRIDKQNPRAEINVYEREL